MKTMSLVSACLMLAACQSAPVVLTEGQTTELLEIVQAKKEIQIECVKRDELVARLQGMQERSVLAPQAQGFLGGGAAEALSMIPVEDFIAFAQRAQEIQALSMEIKNQQVLKALDLLADPC